MDKAVVGAIIMVMVVDNDPKISSSVLPVGGASPSSEPAAPAASREASVDSRAPARLQSGDLNATFPVEAYEPLAGGGGQRRAARTRANGASVAAGPTCTPVSIRSWQPPAVVAAPSPESAAVAAAMTQLEAVEALLGRELGAIPGFAAMVEASASPQLKLFEEHLAQGTPLPPPWALPPEKVAWIRQVLAEVTAATGLELPTNLLFSWACRPARNPGACMNAMHCGDRQIRALQFDPFELSFAHEIIAHEGAHAAFDDAMAAASPLVAKFLELIGKWQTFGDAYRKNASLQPVIPKMEAEARALGFSLNRLDPRTMAIRDAHAELFGDLVACVTRDDPDAVANMLALGGAGAAARSRSFATDFSGEPAAKNEEHVVLRPVRKELWDLKVAHYAGRPQEFVQRVTRALARSYEYQLASERDAAYSGLHDPAATVAYLLECLRDELLPQAAVRP